jgi:hypothetical protein
MEYLHSNQIQVLNCIEENACQVGMTIVAIQMALSAILILYMSNMTSDKQYYNHVENTKDGQRMNKLL